MGGGGQFRFIVDVCVGGGGGYMPEMDLPPCEQNHTQHWKHYFPRTTDIVGNSYSSAILSGLSRLNFTMGSVLVDSVLWG